MQPEATSPRFGHAQIVLTAQRIWEVVGAELIVLAVTVMRRETPATRSPDEGIAGTGIG
jgi:hypothetical protein